MILFKKTDLQSASSASVAVHQLSTFYFFFYFFLFKLLVLGFFVELACFLCCCQAVLSRNHERHCAGQTEHGSEVSLCLDMCSCDLNRDVCLSDCGMCVCNVES